MNMPNWFTIENVDSKSISESDLNKIHEIEQDMWAKWIWEYVKCNCCSIIYSKKDIFGHFSKDIYIETVWKIEQILALDSIKCKKCNSDTISIWWTDYIYDIQERYNEKESFLTAFRDENWEIRWFSDWYINDFETIYKREFEYYYSNIWKEKIKKMINNIIWWELPDKLLMHSTVWVDLKNSNLNIFLIILKTFYNYLEYKWYWNILWIYESSIWTTIHSIYHVSWAKRLWITSNNLLKNKISNINNKSTSDIFIHNDIINSYVKKLELPFKVFLKNNSLKMREVLSR